MFVFLLEIRVGRAHKSAVRGRRATVIGRPLNRWRPNKESIWAALFDGRRIAIEGCGDKWIDSLQPTGRLTDFPRKTPLRGSHWKRPLGGKRLVSRALCLPTQTCAPILRRDCASKSPASRAEV